MFLLLASCLGWGRRILLLLFQKNEFPYPNIIGTALGLVLLCLLSTYTIAVGLDIKVPFFLFLSIGLIAAYPYIPPLFRNLQSWIVQAPWKHKLVGLLILVYACVSLLGGMAPETNFDVGVYHYTIPKESVEMGTWVTRQDTVHSWFPLGWQALYGTSFAILGEPLANQINIMAFLLTLCSVFTFSRSSKYLAMIILLGNLSTAISSSGGLVEIPQGLFILLGIVIMIQGGPGWRWGLLAGVMWGQALSIKPTSCFALFLCLLWSFVENKDSKKIAVCILVTGLISCFWPLKNWLLIGNPAYPFLGSIFPGPLSGLERMIRPITLPSDIMPFLQTLLFNPCMLLFSLAFFSPGFGRRSGIFLTLLLGIAFFTSPFGPENGARFAISMSLPFAAFITANGYSAIERQNKILHHCLYGLAIILCLGVLGVHSWRNGNKVGAAVGLQSRDEYLSLKINTYRAIKRAEKEAQGTPILLIDQRGYYCEGPYISGNDFQEQVQPETFQTVQDFQKWLSENRIQFVVSVMDGTGHTRRFERLRTERSFVWDETLVKISTYGNTSVFRVRKIPKNKN